VKVGATPRRYVIGGAELSREEIVHKYLHLVKYVAGRISVNLPPNVEINDLINDGILGLIDAIEKYDDARGVKFEKYDMPNVNENGISISAGAKAAWFKDTEGNIMAVIQSI